jgi:hypothetical protein
MSYKTALCKAAPSLYTFALKLRHSQLISRVESIPRFRSVHAEQASNGGYFAVNIKGKMGFAAMLSQLIAVILYCDKHNLQPVVRFTNPLYTNESDTNYNWFDDFFQYISDIPDHVIETLTFSDINGQSDYTMTRLDDKISIDQAHALYKKYFRIKPTAVAEADAYAESKFAGQVLGVHYRGTDKKYEAPLLQYDRMTNFIDRVIGEIGFEAGDDFKIFVATDDSKFLDYLINGRFKNNIIYFDCKELGVDGNAIHFSPGDNYRKGVEALSTMYLLSKCSWCVKTASQLSAWAKIINPSLKIYTPEKPFKLSFHFPDKQIWESREQL